MWRSYKSLPTLADLTTLVLSPYYRDDAVSDRDVKIRGLRALSMLATASPNLKELTWACGPAAFGAAERDWNKLGLPGLPQIQVPWRPQKLVLAGIYTTQRELQHFFEGLCGSTRRLELKDVTLQCSGYWVVVFDQIRNTLALDEFKVSGRLVEGYFDSIAAFWHVGPTANVGGYGSRLQEYVTRASSEPPWRTPAAGGTPEEWSERGDDSMTYLLDW